MERLKLEKGEEMINNKFFTKREASEYLSRVGVTCIGKKRYLNTSQLGEDQIFKSLVDVLSINNIFWMSGFIPASASLMLIQVQ